MSINGEVSGNHFEKIMQEQRFWQDIPPLDDPEKNEQRRQKLLERLLQNRLKASLENVADYFSRVCGDVHFGPEPYYFPAQNAIEAKYKSQPFNKLFAFPYQSRRSLVTSRIFGKHRQLAQHYTQARRSLTEDPKAAMLELLSADYNRASIYVRSDFDQQSQVSPELAKTMASDFQQLAITVEAQIAQVLKNVHRHKQMTEIINAAVQDIISNIEVTITLQGGTHPITGQELQSLLKKFFRDQPHATAKLLKAYGKNPQQAIPIEMYFPSSDLVTFQRWLESDETLTQKQAKPQAQVHQRDSASPISTQLSSLAKTNQESSLTFHSVPTDKGRNDYSFPTAISQASVWSIYWSQVCSDLSAIGTRLELMTSTEAIPLLKKEPGILEITNLIIKLQQLSSAQGNAIESYETIRHLMHISRSGGESWAVFTQIYNDLELLIKDLEKLSLKPNQLDYQKKIDTLNDNLKKQIDEYQQKLQAMVPVMATAKSHELLTQEKNKRYLPSFEIFERSAAQAQQLITEITTSREIIHSQLSQAVKVYGSSLRTTPIVPPAVNTEGERVPEVNLAFDLYHNRPDMDRSDSADTTQETPMSLDDLLGNTGTPT